jgi:hypothetical protein
MAGFFITAVLLGQLAMNTLLEETSLAWGIVVVALALEFALILSAKPNARWTVNRLRVGLIAGAIVGAGILLVAPNLLGMWTGLPILLIVLVEEIIGRWLFYEALNERVI